MVTTQCLIKRNMLNLNKFMFSASAFKSGMKEQALFTMRKNFLSSTWSWTYLPYCCSSSKSMKEFNHSQKYVLKNCKRQVATSPLRDNLKKSFGKTLKTFNTWIERVSPTSKQYIDNLTAGTLKTWADIKLWYNVRKRLKSKPNAFVSYREEMSIYVLKRDAVKVAPLFPFCLIPFGFVMLVVPMYLFPRYILPHAFWTESQRKTFYCQSHQGRLKYYHIIINHLNYHKENATDMDLSYVLESVCSAINNNTVPINPVLLQLKPFCSQTQSPLNLNYRKVPLLLQSFSKVIMSTPYLPPNWLCNQLLTYGTLILRLDEKLRSGNDIERLSNEEIAAATLMRGLNSGDLSSNANTYWLLNWLDLTEKCSSNDSWFVLHAMVLLSVNFTEIKYQRKVFS